MRLRDKVLLGLALVAGGLVGYLLHYRFNPYVMLFVGVALAGLGIAILVVSIRLAIQGRRSYLLWVLVIAVYFLGSAAGERKARTQAAAELVETQSLIQAINDKTLAQGGLPPSDLKSVTGDEDSTNRFDLSRFRYESDKVHFVLYFESIRGPGEYRSEKGKIYWYPW